MSYVCSRCGKSHDCLLTDTGYKMPDDVFAIGEPQRSERATCDEDLCNLDERFFIRGILYVPFRGREGSFGWGVWGEVDIDTFMLYLEKFDADASAEPPVSGMLANELPCYEDSKSLPLAIHFGSSKDRPQFFTLPDSSSSLARDQANGIDEDRYHEILKALGAV